MAGPTQIVHTPYGIFKCLKDDLISNQLLQYGAHTRNELAMVLDQLSECHTILDIGAHIGTYSIPIALRYKKSKFRIFCFEGEKSNFSLLSDNISLNDLSEWITPVYGIVVSSDTERVRMQQNHVGNSGASFVSYSDTISESERKIKLSQWLLAIPDLKLDFIKVDIEGMEYGVLKDLRSFLLRDKPILYFEVCAELMNRYSYTTMDLFNLLSDMGYRFYRNMGKRNSDTDEYLKIEIFEFPDEGLYDVLAINS